MSANNKQAPASLSHPACGWSLIRHPQQDRHHPSRSSFWVVNTAFVYLSLPPFWRHLVFRPPHRALSSSGPLASPPSPPPDRRALDVAIKTIPLALPLALLVQTQRGDARADKTRGNKVVRLTGMFEQVVERARAGTGAGTAALRVALHGGRDMDGS